MVLNIIYGLLIVVAIIIIPLRIKARRRTLAEINTLRQSLNQDIKELITKLEPKTHNGKSKIRRILSSEFHFANEKEAVRQLCDYIKRPAFAKPLLPTPSYVQYPDFVRFTYSLHRKRREEALRKLEIFEKPERYPMEEEEDSWVAAQERERPPLLRDIHHVKSLATP